MATYCDIITDSLTFSDGLKAAVTDVVVDGATFSESLSVTVAQAIADSLTISDAMFSFVGSVLRDTLHISDSMVGTFGASKISDTLRFSESLSTTVTDVAQDTLTVSDSIAQGLLFEAIRDLLHLSDSMANFGGGFNAGADHLTFSEKLQAQAQAILSDTITVSDSMHHTAIARNAMADTLTISDTLAPIFAGFDRAADLLHIADAMSHVAAIADVATDAIFISDAMNAKGMLGGAWIAATDGYAMTRYTWRQIRAIGIIDDQIVVAGEGGIYLLAGADDDGDDIAMHAETGLMQVSVPEARDINARDTGDPRIKAASYASIAYQGGPFRIGIGITRDGTERRYWYPFPARIADVPTTNRVKIGRGARSGFWRFLLENVEGSAGMVKEQRVTLDSLSRRI